jgi:predicted metal-dependent hydrolase
LTLVMTELMFHGGGRTLPLVVKRAAVRRMNLRLDARKGAVRLTLPRFVPLGSAMRWVEEKRPWVEDQMGKLPPARPIRPGMVVTLGDARLPLDWVESYPRKVAVIADSIRVGGPEEMLPTRLLRWLKAQALTRLTDETLALVRREGLNVTTIGVGDPTSRWGSCAASGAIRYSWRLILAPDFVLRATVAHEVAHLVHMDHSAAFHAKVASFLGEDPKPAREWLRKNGALLHGFGRD